MILVSAAGNIKHILIYMVVTFKRFLQSTNLFFAKWR